MTTKTTAEVSVPVGVARAHARADDEGSDTALGARRFTSAAAVRGWWMVGQRGGGGAAAGAVAL